MNNHTLNFTLSYDETGFASEYSDNKYIVTINFANKLEDIKSVSIRIYNSNYHFIGADVTQLKPRKSVSHCRFEVFSTENWELDKFFIFVYINDHPTWLATIAFDGIYEKRYHTTLENLNNAPYQKYFIDHLCNTDWWISYEAIGWKNRLFTQAFMNRMLLFLMQGRHHIWNSFPSFFIVSVDSYEPRTFANKVLGRFFAEEKKCLQLNMSALGDKSLDWNKLIQQINASEAVIFDVETDTPPSIAFRKLKELSKMIKAKSFSDIPFIFHGSISTIYWCEQECKNFNALQLPDNTFFLPELTNSYLESDKKKGFKTDYSLIDEEDSKNYTELFDDFYPLTISDFESKEDVSDIKDDSETGTTPNALFTSSTEDSDKATAEEPKDSAEKCLQQLIGLNRVKQEIKEAKTMASFFNIRQSFGLDKELDHRYHMLFLGNPGTGKTTVAKLIGEIYHEMGLLSIGHTIVTDRSHLVGNYIGDSERNTNEAIENARGGVLFIDEAYTLIPSLDDPRDFGQHVLSTLLPILSEPNPDMIIIFAGYENKMENLLKFNQGILDRFPIKLHFKDYSANDLYEIAINVLTSRNFILTEAADSRLKHVIEKTVANRDEFFGNGRWVHNFIEQGIIKTMATRVMLMSVRENDETLYKLIHECDIIEGEKALQRNKLSTTLAHHPIGFRA